MKGSEVTKSSGDVSVVAVDSGRLAAAHCSQLSCLLSLVTCLLTPNHHTLSRLVMSGKESKNGNEAKASKTKRSADTEETDDAKRKKVEQPAGFLVSNSTSLLLDSFDM